MTSLSTIPPEWRGKYSAVIPLTSDDLHYAALVADAVGAQSVANYVPESAEETNAWPYEDFPQGTLLVVATDLHFAVNHLLYWMGESLYGLRYVDGGRSPDVDVFAPWYNYPYGGEALTQWFTTLYTTVEPMYPDDPDIIYLGQLDR